MDKDTSMYHLDSVYICIRYLKCLSTECKGRTKTRNFEGEVPNEYVSITGIHPHHPNPIKHKLCEAKKLTQKT